MLESGVPCASAVFLAVTTCSKISPAVKFRLKPKVPVAQNLHPNLHPTCEETQTVYF